jgi:hypothetical protein
VSLKMGRDVGTVHFRPNGAPRDISAFTQKDKVLGPGADANMSP